MHCGCMHNYIVNYISLLVSRSQDVKNRLKNLTLAHSLPHLPPILLTGDQRCFYQCTFSLFHQKLSIPRTLFIFHTVVFIWLYILTINHPCAPSSWDCLSIITEILRICGSPFIFLYWLQCIYFMEVAYSSWGVNQKAVPLSSSPLKVYYSLGRFSLPCFSIMNITPYCDLHFV